MNIDHGLASPVALRFAPTTQLAHWLVKGIEAIAALMVVVEVVLLFAGVICRYVFHAPLDWSDEVASTLFIWLTMMGAVLALQKGRHMRLTAFTARLPQWAPLLATTASVLTLCFLLSLLWPAWEHLEQEAAYTTAVLGVPGSWRVAALLSGLALMALLTVLDLARTIVARDLVVAVVATGLVAGSLWACGPWLHAMGNYNLIVFFVVLVGACVAGGMPIAFAFGIGTVAFIAFAIDAPMSIVVSRMDEGMSHVILMAVPLFVALGLLLQITGIAQAMVAFLAALLGHVRGGLSYVLLAAMYVVSGISGSKAADIAAIAPALFPEMKRRGYSAGEMGALLSASAAMSETIPPSLVLITIGSVVGVSISALFTAGLIPALVLAVALAVVVRLKAGARSPAVSARPARRELGKLLVVALPALALPFVIRGAVVEGVATATEVATVGIVYALVVGTFVYRRMDWGRLYPMLVETATLSGAILLIMGTATAMGWALSQSGFSRQLVVAMAGMPGGSAGFLAVTIVVFVVLGSLLEGIPAIVLFGPLLYPAARALAISDVQFSMVIVLAMGIGLFAPPFGVGFFAACAIGKVDPNEAGRSIRPYLVALAIGVVLVAAVPWLSTGLL